MLRTTDAFAAALAMIERRMVGDDFNAANVWHNVDKDVTAWALLELTAAILTDLCLATGVPHEETLSKFRRLLPAEEN